MCTSLHFQHCFLWAYGKFATLPSVFGTHFQLFSLPLTNGKQKFVVLPSVIPKKNTKATFLGGNISSPSITYMDWLETHQYQIVVVYSARYSQIVCLFMILIIVHCRCCSHIVPSQIE